MPPALDPATFDAAKNKDWNVLQRHKNLVSKERLLAELWSNRRALAAVTKHHLGRGAGVACDVADPSAWISGSFNVCVPIQVRSPHRPDWKVMLRCPIPSKLAEEYYPGTVEEKMRGEVAAYAFMQKQCPETRIPQLYGFSFGSRTVRPCSRDSRESKQLANVLLAVYA